ncbi:MAG TPA: glycosyltransferase family 25 protein [Dehalococcoidia bacterium]|nr:glycosyltransferase family 25 protein [Dehalococcoidia bacterium]
MPDFSPSWSRAARAEIAHDATALSTKVVVISLPDATERRAAFSARACGVGLDWRFFDAGRGLGLNLTYDPDEAIVSKGRPLSPGELGCYASHYAAWMTFLETRASQLVVLEDDTIVDWTFLEKLARIDLQASGISFLRLFAMDPGPCRRVQANAIEFQRHLIEYVDRVFGAQAYAITRAGAERLILHCQAVRRPIDDELDRSWVHGLPNLCIFPFPVIAQSGVSTIGIERYGRHEVPAPLANRRRRARLTELALRAGRRMYGLLPWTKPSVAPLGQP